ncbi:phosphopyruvate hydratase [Patescibacteria group bacterium]|nr:phosphopyruvate hydratase [Patescibacteria group bacterium]
MAKIKQVTAREILNAKGNPSVETTIYLSDGHKATAASPSGTSVGNYEASDVQDKDVQRYDGKGVLKAVSNVEQVIAPNIIGVEVTKQQIIDRIMIDLDGTQNKSHLGANAILSVSMACAKAAAKSSMLPLFLYLREYVKKENMPLKIPTPAFNILNGGQHAGENVNFQEFMVIPASSIPYPQQLVMANTIYHSLGKILETNNMSTLVGDEGGFAPKVESNKEALTYVQQSILSLNLRIGFDVFMGLDCASNNFLSGKKYRIKDKNADLSSSELISLYQSLNEEFKFLYLEDPLGEDDWEGWEEINTKMSQQTMIIGDDLIATNPYRLQMALDRKAVSGIIIKPNQIGTVIESLAVVEVAKAAGLKIIASHRSGETNDDFIADFAVAISADYVKFGAPVRGERVAKYNRLLEIDAKIKTVSQK